MKEILDAISVVFETLEKIDVRGLRNRKAVVLAQETLIAAYRKLEKLANEGDCNAKNSNGHSESVSVDAGEDTRGDKGVLRKCKADV